MVLRYAQGTLTLGLRYTTSCDIDDLALQILIVQGTLISEDLFLAIVSLWISMHFLVK